MFLFTLSRRPDGSVATLLRGSECPPADQTQKCGSIFGPIKNFRLGVDRGTGMGEPLCFRQIGFAAAYPIFSLPAFINIDRQAEPLDDPPLSVAQWLTAGNVPAIFAIRRPTQAVLTS